MVILQICSKIEAGVPRWSVKKVFLTVSQNLQETIYVGVSYEKILLADWKQTPTQVFPCEFWQVIKNTYFEDLLQVAVNNDSEQYNNLFQ